MRRRPSSPVIDKLRATARDWSRGDDDSALNEWIRTNDFRSREKRDEAVSELHESIDMLADTAKHDPTRYLTDFPGDQIGRLAALARFFSLYRFDAVEIDSDLDPVGELKRKHRGRVIKESGR